MMKWEGGNRYKASKIYAGMKLQGAYVFIGKSPGTKHHFGPIIASPIRIEVGVTLWREADGTLRAGRPS